MKSVILMLASMLAMTGCSVAEELPAPHDTPDVVSSVEESDAEASDLDVDSEDDVPMLESEQLSDVEEEAASPDAEESSDAEEPADVNLEDEPPLDEDPTRFGADAFSAAFIPSYQIP
jgi:hypothetical protein